jgi:hypothetical protein
MQMAQNQAAAATNAFSMISSAGPYAYSATIGPNTPIGKYIVKPISDTFYGGLGLVANSPIANEGFIMALEGSLATRPAGATLAGVRGLARLGGTLRTANTAAPARVVPIADDPLAAVSGRLNVVDLAVKFKPGWSLAQRADAVAKTRILTEADTVVLQTERGSTSARSMFKRAGNEVSVGKDVDHMVDLQLGGSHTLSNFWTLDSSVNRSLGAQIQQQIKNLPPGTVVRRVTIGD